MNCYSNVFWIANGAFWIANELCSANAVLIALCIKFKLDLDLKLSRHLIRNLLANQFSCFNGHLAIPSTIPIK